MQSLFSRNDEGHVVQTCLNEDILMNVGNQMSLDPIGFHYTDKNS